MRSESFLIKATLQNSLEKREVYLEEYLQCSGGFRICERVVPTSGAQSAPEKFWVTTPIFAVKTRPFLASPI